MIADDARDVDPQGGRHQKARTLLCTIDNDSTVYT